MSIPKQSKEERIFRIYQELESDPRRLAYIECPVCNARHCILLELMPSSLEINCNGCEHLFTVYKNELSPHQWMKEELEKILLPEKEKKILEKYNENVLELESLTNEALFAYAFSLGVRLAVVCLHQK
jgi:hypothetical protein